MKIGRITESFDAGEQEKQEENENTETEYESDGMQYHVESFEKKFHDLFSRKYDALSEDQKKDVSGINEERADRNMKGYLDMLDENTSDVQEDDMSSEMEYSEEELEDIWENDPGYLNETAMKDLDDPGVQNSEYMKTGFHNKGLLNYEKDSVDNTEKNVELPVGKILERWGSEEGSYLTDPEADYDSLHLNVSKDKLECNTYEVIKPFEVVESKIADQPFDEEKVDENSEKGERATQYKAGMCVEDLVELGFLKKVEGNKK